MVYGAGGTGVRVMTSSSSPGISLKAEGISYCAGAEIPCVIVNIVRGGPGLGGIQPAQSDYYQATKALGHGDFFVPVLAPSSIQEMVDCIGDAFDMADEYRTPVMVMGDGMLGQMMEPVEFHDREQRELPAKDWAADGLGDRTEHNVINSLFLQADKLEQHNLKLFRKYDVIKEKEVRYELFNCEDADLILVAYGTTARICKNAIKLAEAEGLKVGLVRPISLWPFPVEAFEKTIDSTKHGFLTVEMSMGQMVDDVRMAVLGRQPVEFYGRTGGMIPTPEEILGKIKEMAGGK
jgi:2-oxoglutarate ferredoxin oxidoreductase subunit alpha